MKKEVSNIKNINNKERLQRIENTQEELMDLIETLIKTKSDIENDKTKELEKYIKRLNTFTADGEYQIPLFLLDSKKNVQKEIDDFFLNKFNVRKEQINEKDNLEKVLKEIPEEIEDFL